MVLKMIIYGLKLEQRGRRLGEREKKGKEDKRGMKGRGKHEKGEGKTVT